MPSICIIGSELCGDEQLVEAAESFKASIVYENDVNNLKNKDVLYIIDEFEGEQYELLHKNGFKLMGPTALKQLCNTNSPLPHQTRPLYCLSMSGVTLCFTGFRESTVVAHYATLIHHMGGSIRKDFSTNVTHIVAKTTRGDKYRYAAAMGLPILSESWLHSAWNNRHDPSFFVTKADLDQFKLPPFFSCRLAFHGFQSDDEKHMKDMASANGATLTDVTDPECTHVIVEADCDAPVNLPTKTYVVKSDWFWASIRVDSCAEEKIYLHNQEDENRRKSNILSPYNHHPSQNKRISRGYKRKRDLKETVAQLAKEGAQLDALRRISTDVKGNQSCGSIGSILDGSNLLSPDVAKVENISTVIVRSPEVKPSTKRHFVCMELVQTESNYVQILDTILQIKSDLEESQVGGPLLNATEVKIIFGNVPPIHDIHSKLLTDLQSLCDNWNEENQIGEVMLKYSGDLMKAYPSFVNFFEKTKETLKQCDANKARFHAFLKLWQSKKQCGRQSLQELLIRPVQRLPSVILLLSDILKHTNKCNPDYNLLEKAISSIKEVVTLINECKRKTEGQVAMFSIFNEVENCPPNLLSSHRSLVIQADLLILNESLGRKGEHLTMFLFSDILEICKKRQKVGNSLKSPSMVNLQTMAAPPAKQKCYKHLELMPLSHVKRVVDINETDEVKNVFALICRSNEELKERLYTFALVDKDVEKSQLLQNICRNTANTVCRNDAESFLTFQDPLNLDINTSDISTKTISKMLGGIAKGKDKLCRALSLKRNNTLTPRMMKKSTPVMSGRRLSRAVSSIISPVRAAFTPTHFGSSTLHRFRGMSTTNLQDSPEPSPVPISKKAKCQTLGSSARHII